MSSYVSRVIVATCCSAALLFACRDLDFPGAREPAGTAPPPNEGPAVAFADPGSGSRVPLQTEVRLVAHDVNGTREVNLSCANGVPLRRWISSPYEGTVDLTGCISGTAPVERITLTADAFDLLGARGEAAVLELDVDREAAALTVELPERVSPGGALVGIVRSDRPLQAPPEVRVEGAAAAVTSLGNDTYRAELTPAPRMGTDLTANPPSTEALLQTERLLGVTIEARSLTGNPTRLERTVLLSRVLWARTLTEDVPDPGLGIPHGAASPLGLHLPVPGPRGVTRAFALTADGGALVPPGPAMVDGGTGDPNLRAFDEDAIAYTSLPGPTFHLVEAVTGSVHASFPTGLRFSTFVFPLGGSVCEERDPTLTASCSAVEVRCENSQGQSSVAPVSGLDQTFALSTSASVSGGSYLLLNGTCCLTGAVIGDASGARCLTTALGPTTYPTTTGAFVTVYPPATLVRLDGTTAEFPLDDSFATPVIAARRDETILVAETQAQQTTFVVTSLSGPVSSVTVAGTFVPFELTETVLAIRDRTYVLDSDNALTALIEDSARNVYVARFDAAGTPKWFHRVGTRVTGREAFVSGGAYLRAAPTGPIYFVDSDTDRVLAFGR